MKTSPLRSFLAASLLTSVMSADGATIVYDGLNAGTVYNFTGSTPRTFMSQAFSIADPGVPVEIESMRVVVVTGGAVNYANTRLRMQLWDTFDAGATGTTQVFSNPSPLQSFETGPISSSGAQAFIVTLDFPTPITLTGTANHGISFNWQSDAAGTGSFIDDTLLTIALRTGSSAPPPALTLGTNLNPSGGYYRNASGLTNFNAQANDARSIANVGGLAFELTAVPEPSGPMLLLSSAGLLLLRRRRH